MHHLAAKMPRSVAENPLKAVPDIILPLGYQFHSEGRDFVLILCTCTCTCTMYFDKLYTCTGWSTGTRGSSWTQGESTQGMEELPT